MEQNDIRKNKLFNSRQTMLFLLLAGGLLLSLGSGAAGYYLGKSKSVNPSIPAPSPTYAPETPPEQGVFCTMDAKLCPDGSAVGRVPPECEFAPCPGPGSEKPGDSPENSSPQGSGETVDFAQCTPGTGFNRTVGFGSTSLEVLEDRGDTCIIRTTNEVEGSYSVNQCTVPQHVGALSFSISDTGADFSLIDKYCTSKSRSDVKINN